MITYNDMKRKPNARFYHVYIKGLENNLIFRDREDYITGMNYVSICSFWTAVSMLAFTLMSNHFHFIVYGTEEEAKGFIDLYKRNISRYLSIKYNTNHLLRHVKTDCKLITNSGDALKIAIAYVLRNHIKAGINQTVQGYEWSSGYCYFAGTDLLEGCSPTSSLGTEEYRRTLHSKIRLDDKYLLNSKGYIEPASYVCIDFVESCFGRVQSFDYFIYKAGSTAKPKEGPVDFSDEFVLTGLKEIISKKYEVTELEELNEVLKKEVMLLLKRQFNCSPKQLARTMQMSLKDVNSILSL